MRPTRLRLHSNYHPSGLRSVTAASAPRSAEQLRQLQDLIEVLDDCCAMPGHSEYLHTSLFTEVKGLVLVALDDEADARDRALGIRGYRPRA